MGLIAKAEGGSFELAPEGTFLARCWRIIDMGTQHMERWDKFVHKVLITWELPTELMSDERPFSISKKYTVSLHEKATLRKDLESWRGKAFNEPELEGFELKNLLGIPCYINITHSSNGDRTYANVTGLMKLPKGVDCPDIVNESLLLDLDPDKFNPVVFEQLGKGLQEAIRESLEFKGLKYDDTGVGEEVPETCTEAGTDDIPF